MAINDVVNKDGSINYDAIGGFKDQLDNHTTQLAQITSQNNNTNTYVYNADGSVQSVTTKDTNNNVIQIVTYTYNASGDVSQSVTVANGKTVTITYNYDANGNITSTVNALS